ncbi:hypothetical protein X798_07082 [Onchocerca flexuosa]|uniref:Transmembrane protein 115 n=1 Tax=Onchocerca flexuosa TaxID=387005 RepID=A0A238BMQ5_9BILA|nr:hypothetical protein X798_07082 [Onchocerca flexuosa]
MLCVYQHADVGFPSSSIGRRDVVDGEVFYVTLFLGGILSLSQVIFEFLSLTGDDLIGSSLLIAIVALLTFIITANDIFFFRTYIFGLPAACSAVCVAMKQYLPDSVLLTTPIGRVKNTHLPFCIIVGASFLVGFGLLRWVSLLQILFGIQISWTYLRFLQPHDVGEPKGDASEHFAWATLFPSKLQPLMRVLSSAVYTCLIQVRLCKPVARHIDLMQLDSVNVILPSLHTRDTERRRQKALRDLTERLNRVQQAEMGLWPEMEDVEEGITVQDTSAIQQQKESGPQASKLKLFYAAHFHSQQNEPLIEEIDADKEKEKAVI